MSKIEDGGAAYPVITWESPQGFAIGSMEHGLTKREAFAMAAMQGIAGAMVANGADAPAIASWSVIMADALLAALRGDA
jgi:hypothetical protein